MLPPLEPDVAIAKIVREQWGRLLAALTSRLGDLQLAEDVLQDAVTKALVHWKEHGIPASPSGWLIQTATHKAIDRFRRDSRFAKLSPQFAYEMELASDSVPDLPALIEDKRLELIFTCCHPAMDQHSRVALTLHTLGGLTTEEIGRAFLVNKKTMAQRLVRAKKKIRLARIPFTTPDKDTLLERISTVLSVIYLVFNEGHSATDGNRLFRKELSDEAIRLSRTVHELLPDQPEVMGLMSLMLMHDARYYSRISDDNHFIPLENQNRSRWDRSRIEEASQLIKSALSAQQPGPYQIQAAISAIHCEAGRWEDTDWRQIVELYELLYQMQPSPIVKINQAMAISYAHSPLDAMAVLDNITVTKAIERYQPFFAAYADIHIRLGDATKAKDCLNKAIELSENVIERNYLKTRLNSL